MYDRLEARLRSYGLSREDPPPFIARMIASGASDDQIHAALDAIEDDIPADVTIRPVAQAALWLAVGVGLGLLL
jgi:hypothetical protein